MKKFLVILNFLIISCSQTPKVAIEEHNDLTNNSTIPNPVEEKNQNNKNEFQENNHSPSAEEDTTQLEQSKDKLEQEEKAKKEKEEKEKEKEKEKKKEEEPVEPDFPDLPETDVYNPKEDPAPNEFILVDKEAKPKNLDAVLEEIKADAKLYGVKGKAVVGVLVSTHGNYLKHYFFGVTNKRLEFIVADKIQKLKFKPATSNGQPVKMWYKMTIEIN